MKFRFTKYLAAGLVALLLVANSIDDFAYAGRGYSSGRSSSSRGFSSRSSSSSHFSRPSSSYSSRSSSSSSKYSSGRSSSSSRSSRPSSSYSSSSSSSSSKYSSRPSSSSSSPSTSSSSSRRTTSSGYSSSMTAAQRKAASQKAYQSKIAASKPKSSYKTSGGKTVKVDTPTSKKAQSEVRKYVTHERYVTYDSRARGFYGSHYSQPVHYNDYFSPFLMGYLLSDTLNSNQRAQWMYHHRKEMDDARYQAMLAKDAKLEAEIAKLKAEGVQPNPNYTPEGMDRDIMYDDDFVLASLGVEEGYKPAVQTESGSTFLSAAFWFFVAITLFIFLYWLFCVKNFKQF